MELIVGLVTFAVGLTVVGLALRVAFRALAQVRRRRPTPAGPPGAGAELRARLRELEGRGFALADEGERKIVLRLPLAEVGSWAGRLSEEYRILVELDAASRTARLSERRISRESGFGGAAAARWSASTGPTAGVRDLGEAGGVAAPGGAGGRYGLDTAAARALVEQAITGAGWRVT